MTEQPKISPVEASKDASAASGPKMSPRPVQNPVFRMMGLPNFRLKLPSRNWLIFLSVTGSFTTALLYDRYHKKKSQKRWCNLVSHVSQEILPGNLMPRRITIFLSAPPGDGIRAAREHFHEYVKPILVAGALDWDVIEGRREGDVRAGLAEKIRKLRKRQGDISPLDGPKDEEEDLLEQLRKHTGTREWDGVQGDLILGRHTWKEYLRGLHEGWLGPLDPQSPSEAISPETPPPEASPSTPPPPSPTSPDPISNLETTAQTDPATPPLPDPPPPKKPVTPTPPYILPLSYGSTALPSTIPQTLPPSLPLPFPHLLGFFNTPTRMYRFLTRRHLADSTGRSVAALVLASSSRPYYHDTDFVSAGDPDSPTAAGDQDYPTAEGRTKWEQEEILLWEEKEWHKSAWKKNEEGKETERPWMEEVFIDSRIGQRMSMFEMVDGEVERGELSGNNDVKLTEGKSWVEAAKEWVGLDGVREKEGWEMGLEGGEDD